MSDCNNTMSSLTFTLKESTFFEQTFISTEKALSAPINSKKLILYNISKNQMLPFSCMNSLFLSSLNSCRSLVKNADKMVQSIQESTKYNLWKTTFKKFYYAKFAQCYFLMI